MPGEGRGEGLFPGVAEGGVAGGGGVAPRAGGGRGEGLFPGVAEGGVAEVVAEGYGFGEVFVEVEGAGDGAGYLHHLQRVGEAGTEVVAVGGYKDLGLVHEAAEGFGVDDPVPVALELVAHTVRGLGPDASRARLAGPVPSRKLGRVRRLHAGRRERAGSVTAERGAAGAARGAGGAGG